MTDRQLVNKARDAKFGKGLLLARKPQAPVIVGFVGRRGSGMSLGAAAYFYRACFEPIHEGTK